MKGLSLSFCISDICRGEVREKDVEIIETMTKAQTEKEWVELLEHYAKIYWNGFPKKAVALANKLKREGKIRQPRLNSSKIRNISNGHWL